MTDNLDTLTNAQLDELCAVEVAKIPRLFTLMKRGYYYRVNAAGYTDSLEEAWKVTEDVADWHVNPNEPPVTKHRLPHPPYTTDANVVFPLLEDTRGGKWRSTYAGPMHSCITGYTVHIENAVNAGYYGRADTLARAAVIALIREARANGA